MLDERGAQAQLLLIGQCHRARRSPRIAILPTSSSLSDDGGAVEDAASSAPPAGLPPATGGSMLSAVSSSLAGQPSSRLTSFGLSTPAARAFCQLVHRASGS